LTSQSGVKEIQDRGRKSQNSLDGNRYRKRKKRRSAFALRFTSAEDALKLDDAS